jgi:hypothetical protein
MQQQYIQNRVRFAINNKSAIEPYQSRSKGVDSGKAARKNNKDLSGYLSKPVSANGNKSMSDGTGIVSAFTVNH